MLLDQKNADFVLVTRPFLSNLEIAATNSGILFLPKENIAVKKACRGCWAYRMYNERAISFTPENQNRETYQKLPILPYLLALAHCKLDPPLRIHWNQEKPRNNYHDGSMNDLGSFSHDLHVLFLQISEFHWWIYIIKRL